MRPKRFLKAFISYSTVDKLIGGGVKELFKSFGIDSFLAHDDIHISEQWKHRILRELEAAEIAVPILSKSFRGSDWAPQEIGIASQKKNVLIIPISLDGTIPYGFIGHIQGKPLHADAPYLPIFAPALLEKYPTRILPHILELLSQARSFRYAESTMELLVPYFSRMNREQVGSFVNAAIGNGQIWSASDCQREFIPRFIKVNRKKIDPEKLKVLEYQIQHNTLYRPEQNK